MSTYKCPNCHKENWDTNENIYQGYICYGDNCNHIQLPAPNGNILNGVFNMEIYINKITPINLVCTEINLYFASEYWGNRKSINDRIKIDFSRKRRIT